VIFEKAGLTADLAATNAREYRTPANRPRFSALENARLRVHGIEAMPALGDAVGEYMEARKRYLR
jgi:dTDP-4-dehydrorhamnose reductase